MVGCSTIIALKAYQWAYHISVGISHVRGVKDRVKPHMWQTFAGLRVGLQQGLITCPLGSRLSFALPTPPPWVYLSVPPSQDLTLHVSGTDASQTIREISRSNGDELRQGHQSHKWIPGWPHQTQCPTAEQEPTQPTATKELCSPQRATDTDVRRV
ncbi:hypothetical protein NDU88_002195 [Pleurodeles waltl]|uniref:Uncharacterized protein n=1 Tax=Pleurodeles waltl TaxID=8319 RepID=A0AAV7KY86_PLEWA|nr:hypothetical protein NDU88_002195 [Pleurodeles waltl]